MQSWLAQGRGGLEGGDRCGHPVGPSAPCTASPAVSLRPQTARNPRPRGWFGPGPTAEENPLSVAVGLFTGRKESSVTSVRWDSLAPYPRGGPRAAGAPHAPSQSPTYPRALGAIRALSPNQVHWPAAAARTLPSTECSSCRTEEHSDQSAPTFARVFGRVTTLVGTDDPGSSHRLAVRPILPYKCY